MRAATDTPLAAVEATAPEPGVSNLTVREKGQSTNRMPHVCREAKRRQYAKRRLTRTNVAKQAAG